MDKGTSFTFTDFNQDNITNGYGDLIPDNVRGIAWGVEVCPSTGRRHNQGYIQMRKQCRFATIKKFMGKTVHLEVMHGSIKQNETYCSKEKNYSKIGNFVSQGQRSDLLDITAKILEGTPIDNIAIEHPVEFVKFHRGLEKLETIVQKKQRMAWRNVKTTTITGISGAGKTRYVMDKYGYENVFVITAGCDPKFLFDGYNGEKVLLIDEFSGWLKYQYLLNILDGYPLRCNVKNSYTQANWDKVYITSNRKPGNFYNNIYDNLKRRVHVCLQVAEGNTEPLPNPWRPVEAEAYGQMSRAASADSFDSNSSC